MIVVTEAGTRTHGTPNAETRTHAAPSLGSTELASWRVRMAPGAEGPVHAIDREQVFLPLAGSFAITVAGDTTVVTAGEAAILPAAEIRQIRVAEGPAEALVCMPVGGTATVPGTNTTHPLPWAE